MIEDLDKTILRKTRNRGFNEGIDTSIAVIKTMQKYKLSLKQVENLLKQLKKK